MGLAKPQLLVVCIAAVLPASISTAASPRVIIFSLGDDYMFNNVGYPHGPQDYANPEVRCGFSPLRE